MALAVFNPLDGVGPGPLPPSGQGGVGPRQGQGRHPLGEGTQGQGQVAVLRIVQIDARRLGVLHGRLHAGAAEQVHRGHVQRPGKGFPQGHRAVVSPSHVAWGIAAAKVPLGILHKAGGQVAEPVHRRRVHRHRLKGGARLALDGAGPVESPPHLIIPAPHHRPDQPGIHVQAHQGGLGPFPVRRVRGEEVRLGKQLLGALLHLGIQPGIQLVAPGQ